MEFKINLEDVERSAAGQWGYILARLAPDLSDALNAPKKHHPCPVHGGSDGFRLFNDYEQTGGGICNTCGPKSKGISLIMWANGWNFKETLDAVSGVIGLTEETELQPQTHGHAKREPRIDPQEVEKKRGSLRKMWKECVSVTHKDAEPLRLYMLRRRLEYRDLPNSIRFHPSLSYYDDEGKKVGEFPAMVCSVFDKNAKPITLHRTYLTSDGLRPKGLQAKKIMPVPPDVSLMGGSIWLNDKCKSSPIVAVTEGVETGLAVQLAKGIPTFAAVTAVGMKAWEPTSCVRRLMVFADKDRKVMTAGRMVEPGQDAAKHLVSEMWKQNIKASVIIPGIDIPEGRKNLDWADMYARYGKAAFANIESQEEVKHG